MTTLKLFTEEVNNSFFEEYDFISIKTSLKEYNFCWILNDYLSMNFHRNSELDIKVYVENKPINLGLPNLFSHEKENNKLMEVLYFSVFVFQIPHSENRYFVYSNKYKAHYLIPELKEYDYFILTPKKSSSEKQNFIQLLKSLEAIQIAKELSVLNLKSKENFVL